MPAPEDTVSDDTLPERQRAFLMKLRGHDKRVQIFRAGERLMFHGPIIGDGPMPIDEPAAPDSEG
jgi:hypothetical protein